MTSLCDPHSVVLQSPSSSSTRCTSPTPAIAALASTSRPTRKTRHRKTQNRKPQNRKWQRRRFSKCRTIFLRMPTVNGSKWSHIRGQNCSDIRSQKKRSVGNDVTSLYFQSGYYFPPPPIGAFKDGLLDLILLKTRVTNLIIISIQVYFSNVTFCDLSFSIVTFCRGK